MSRLEIYLIYILTRTVDFVGLQAKNGEELQNSKAVSVVLELVLEAGYFCYVASSFVIELESHSLKSQL